MKKTAIYPGTFDPITFGHIDLIQKSLKIVDKIIDEPVGGAHRHFEKVSDDLKVALIKSIEDLKLLSKEELIKKRNNRYLNYIV